MAHGVAGSIFEQVVLGIKVKYDADSAAPAIATEAWRAGRLESSNQVAAPSVSFRRAGGIVQATTQTGKHQYTDGEGNPAYYVAKYEEVANVEAMIVTDSWQQLDSVWSSLIAASREYGGGKDIVPGTYTHLTEGDDGADFPVAQAGKQIMVQAFTWTLLIPHVFGAEAEINTIVNTPHLIDVNADPGTTEKTITQP